MSMYPVGVVRGSGNFVHTFLAAKEQLSTHTKKAYKVDLGRFFAFLGHADLARVTLEDLLAYRKSLEVLKPAAMARSIATVRSLYTFAVQQGVLPHNLGIVLKVPKVPVTSENRFLTDSEAIRLLAQLKQQGARDYLLGALFLRTGARLAEIAEIKWQHFYEDRDGYIGVTLYGKRGKQRHVAVPADLWQLVTAYKGTSRLNAQDDAKLFTISHRQIERVISGAAKAACIEKGVSPHWLRHTAVTMALEGGSDAETVREMAGHSDLRITTRYIHIGKRLAKSGTHTIRLAI